MKKRKMIFCCVLLVSCFVFSGCGETMYQLTDDEAAIIAQYSAKVVSKFNKNQKNGLCHVTKDEEDTSTADEKQPSEDDTNTGDGSNTKQQNNTDTDVSEVSLTDAIGVEGVSFTYTGFEIQTAYQSTDYFVLTPNNGNFYLVLNFDVANNTSQEIPLDLLSRNLVYRATVNGATTASSETTILMNDLTTFQGNIEAGATQSFVVLFQFKTDSLADMSQLTLQMKENGTSYNILLQ